MSAPIKHSPSPLHVDDSGSGRYRTTVRDSENRIVAHIPRHVVGWGTERANADLFAAAPELADALAANLDLIRRHYLSLAEKYVGTAWENDPALQKLKANYELTCAALKKAGRV